MSDLDDAASAFDVSMGNRAPVARTNEDNGPSERLFSAVGDVENPEEPAGGDDLPFKGVDDQEERPAQRQRLRSRQEIELPDDEDEDPDAALYEEPESEEESELDVDHIANGADDEDEEESEEEDQGKLVRIPENVRVRTLIDGKPGILSGKDLLAGTIRLKTFHQRLDNLNKGKKIVQEEAAKLLNDRKQVLEMINSYGEAISALVPKEPDWDKLYADDPKGAREMQRNYEGLQKTLSNLFAARQKILADAAADATRQTTQFAADEQEKFEAANPVWLTDPARKQKDLVAMVKTGLAMGFTPEEIDATYDSRMLTTLLKASKYDRIVASRPRPDRRGKTPVNPGGGPRSRGTAPRGIASASRKLAQTGSVEDAASVFRNIIK